MKVYFRFLVLWLCMLSAGHAAEVISWRLPLEKYAPEGTKAEGVIRLAQPPETSVFFRPEDELWDISKVDSADAKAQGLDWLVWNATSNRLVAKGEMLAIRRLHHRMEVWRTPVRVKLHCEVFPAVERREFMGSEKPEASCVIMLETGTRGRNDGQTGRGKLDLIVDAVAGEGPDVHLQFDLRFIPETRPSITVEGLVMLRDGVATWVAGDWNGEYGHDIRITATIVLEDGSSRAEVALREERGSAVSIDLNPSETKWPVPAAGGYFISLAVDNEVICKWPGLNPGVPRDPFSTAALKPGTCLSGVPRSAPPRTLDPWVHGPVIHIDSLLPTDMGTMQEGEYAGYDPIAELRFFIRRIAQGQNFSVVFLMVLSIRSLPTFSVFWMGRCESPF